MPLEEDDAEEEEEEDDKVRVDEREGIVAVVAVAVVGVVSVSCFRLCMNLGGFPQRSLP